MAKKAHVVAAAEILDVDQPKVSALIRGRLAGFSLDRQTSQARQILKKLLAGPIRFVPETDGRREGWRFRGNGSLVKLLAGSQWASMVASPTGTALALEAEIALTWEVAA